MTPFQLQERKMKSQDDFIAALDQSGGNTPKRRQPYGVLSDAWSNQEQTYASLAVETVDFIPRAGRGCRTSSSSSAHAAPATKWPAFPRVTCDTSGKSPATIEWA